MITLDQIKQLDTKVRKAIDKINSLTNENKMLKNKLDDYQLRIEELEILIDSFKEDQSEIENGIIEALNQLEIIDDDSKTPDLDSEKEGNDQVDVKVISDEKPDNLRKNNDVISETNPDNNDEPGENKGNSDIELDIF